MTHYSWFFPQVMEDWRWYITKMYNNTCGYMLASKQYCLWDIRNNTGQTQSGNISSQHSAHSFLSISLVNNLGGGDWNQQAPAPDLHSNQVTLLSENSFIFFTLRCTHANMSRIITAMHTYKPSAADVHTLLPSTPSYPPPPIDLRGLCKIGCWTILHLCQFPHSL